MAKKKTTKNTTRTKKTSKAKNPGAKTKPSANNRHTPAKSRQTTGVRVRMYRQGLGDCFLLTFPKPGGGDFFVLIDCGVILGTPNADQLMKEVVADIAQTTKRLDVLVATHEHWDHVSAFHPDKELFKDFEIGQVWLAWTEDPSDTTANQLRHDRNRRLAALWLGVGAMQQRLGAGADPEIQATLERSGQVLSFFGIDADEPPPSGGFGAAAAAASNKTGAAMQWVRQRTANPKFCSPGDLIELPQAGGVRVYVLGPPKDRTQLFKDLPTRAGHETYDDKPASPALAMQAFFAGAFTDDQQNLREEFDPTLPVDAKYQISAEQAQSMDFFRDHYLGSANSDPEAWRRIQGEWMAGAAEFALQLDSDTNNTSLALAFELPDGRVLLFPGDAQVGNWESWHADADGNKRVWKVVGKEITAELLLNRTVLYKVGHHGSHNATLREKGLEMMTDPNLTAMVPVDVYIAHEKKHWMRMPFTPLMSRLNEKTKGRILQADQPLATPAKGRRSSGKSQPATNNSFVGHVADSDKILKVTGPGSRPEDRPLYVEFTLP